MHLVLADDGAPSKLTSCRLQGRPPLRATYLRGRKVPKPGVFSKEKALVGTPPQERFWWRAAEPEVTRAQFHVSTGEALSWCQKLSLLRGYKLHPRVPRGRNAVSARVCRALLREVAGGLPALKVTSERPRRVREHACRGNGAKSPNPSQTNCASFGKRGKPAGVVEFTPGRPRRVRESRLL